MINLFFIIVIGGIVCCYVGNSLMEKRRADQERFWQDFLLRMARTGRLVDEYYHPLPEAVLEARASLFLREFQRHELLKNDLEALYLTPDVVVRVEGSRVSIEHRPAYYEDSLTVG